MPHTRSRAAKLRRAASQQQQGRALEHVAKTIGQPVAGAPRVPRSRFGVDVVSRVIATTEASDNLDGKYFGTPTLASTIPDGTKRPKGFESDLTVNGVAVAKNVRASNVDVAPAMAEVTTRVVPDGWEMVNGEMVRA